MFLFKKMLSSAILPLSLCVLLLLLGLILLWFTRRQRTGKLLVTAGVVLLLLQSYGVGFAPALESLERQYPPVASLTGVDAKWVVVLGGGTSSDGELPLHLRMGEASLARLVEGIRLYRQLPGAKLVVSGGRVYGSGADSDSMRALALDLGVNAADIVTDAKSCDTESQAEFTRQLVGDDKVLLVTSASHMLRAVGLFEREGVKVLPAPAHFLEQDNAAFSPTDVFPNEKGFLHAQRLAYEYMGIGWAKLRGKL